jgi:hypothetical protein
VDFPYPIGKFRSTLPAVKEWIEGVLEENKGQAIPVINFAFPRLEKVYPLELLSKAKAVIVAGRVPFPPLGSMGLPELSQMESMPLAGITYKDTFFVSRLQQTERLHFHELVHVVQWERLGVDNFLLAYGVGLLQFGYQNSPLERMASSLQASFDRGALFTSIIELIRQGTDAIWSGVASVVSQV